MFNVDPTLLKTYTLTTPVTLVQAGPEVIDHPSAWLDMLAVLPCVGTDDVCLVAGFGATQRITVQVADLADPVIADSRISGSRRFKLRFSDANFTCGAVAEFAVSATADQLDVQLSLISAEEFFLDSPEFAAALVVSMSSLLSRAAVDVVAVVYRALSSDLADTVVRLTLAAPDESYRDICKYALAEVSFLDAELKEVGAPFAPSVRTLFANAPEEVQSKVSQPTKIALSTAERLALAVNLVTLREGRGLKQLEVAHLALGLSKSHAAVSRLERGILTDVEVERLERLAAFFGTEISALLKNRLTSGEPNEPDEGEGLSIFDTNCDFTPSANFGNRLTLARTSAGMSLSALSRKLEHMEPITVCEWEAEKATPRRTSFIDLAQALEVPVSWLMFGRRVATPTRALALRLTAIQKLYGLTNGQIGSLLENSNDADELESARCLISRLTLGRHPANPKVLRGLSVALQVPQDWISPPDAESLRIREQNVKIETVRDATPAGPSTAAMSMQGRKLISDLIDLLDMGLITDDDARILRGDLVTRFTAAVIRPNKHLAASAATAAARAKKAPVRTTKAAH